MCLTSMNSSMPRSDPSRPIPDSFTPPKGTTQLEMELSFIPTCEGVLLQQAGRQAGQTAAGRLWETVAGVVVGDHQHCQAVYQRRFRLADTTNGHGWMSISPSQPLLVNTTKTLFCIYHADFQFPCEPHPLRVVLGVDVAGQPTPRARDGVGTQTQRKGGYK